MFKEVLINGNYDVLVKNDHDQEKTTIGIGDWNLIFYEKKNVEELIQNLTKALEFWEFEGEAND